MANLEKMQDGGWGVEYDFNKRQQCEVSVKQKNHATPMPFLKSTAINWAQAEGSQDNE